MSARSRRCVRFNDIILELKICIAVCSEHSACCWGRCAGRVHPYSEAHPIVQTTRNIMSRGEEVTAAKSFPGSDEAHEIQESDAKNIDLIPADESVPESKSVHIAEGTDGLKELVDLAATEISVQHDLNERSNLQYDPCRLLVLY